MFQINISQLAEQDMLDCAKYIAGELRNRTAAERLLNDAEEAIYSLEEMPFRYPLANDDVLAQQGFRYFPVHNYLLFYIVREETKTVVIERFLYGRRDWMNLLKGENKRD